MRFCSIYLLSALFAITTTTAALSQKEEKIDKQIEEFRSLYERPTDIPEPKDNKFSKAKHDLGHKLFFDPRLSKTGVMSCATCHNPSLGWEDGLSKGLGHKGNRLGRHSPTVLNLAWASQLFWDGRAATLEEQAKGPILSPDEMGMTKEGVVKKVKAIKGYGKLFKDAFQDEEISLNTIAKAIASFERRVISPDSRFDKWVKGDKKALTLSEKKGFLLFNTKASCAACHAGWRFTDDNFHDIGLASKDIGRGALDKNDVSMKHAFKTPTLRNIADRPPYMHDGSIATLDAVMKHYESGFKKRESLSGSMQAFKLTKTERGDLVAFLRSLSSYRKIQTPVLPAE